MRQRNTREKAENSRDIRSSFPCDLPVQARDAAYKLGYRLIQWITIIDKKEVCSECFSVESGNPVKKRLDVQLTSGLSIDNPCLSLLQLKMIINTSWEFCLL